MWLTGYWMERGFGPEEILALSKEEKSVWQAIAELNREQQKQDMRDAVLEALHLFNRPIKRGVRGFKCLKYLARSFRSKIMFQAL